MRALLTASFRQALEQTHPAHLTAQHLPQEAPALIVSVGKAAMSMLAAARERFPEAPFIAVPKAEAGRAWPQAERGQIIPARHPVPDEQSVRAAQIILQAVSRLQASDLLPTLRRGDT
ncbi:DUF4147 domain-containing protein [Meiothermus ruber]|uniref:Hydroxypyruvate reductase n=1 Tax=Meiothermus ruber (strain ATCC 35948 / DSM 1279 / VKM B-1258 / 21) TaxID=504728 RepID=D3PNW0_MEIRD|nr:DUF4147 domain-containing protein [Meiothermus ruber]ADD29505.1 putative hydroxypyruvate reductase [Meiothermus ruber DSM 1279]AGK05044.1 putative hydroxypyruvate reductase [Meiothermus ruber DSM 1279]